MPETVQKSFTGGELAPAVQARADISRYTSSLNLCENFFVRSQGGVYSRAGFRFVGELDDSDRVARLVPFAFNTQQTYILVFEHLKIRVIRDAGYILDGGVGPNIFELATPYTEDELYQIGFTQNADVMTLVHPEHAPRNLSRTSDFNWTLDVIDYGSQIAAPTFLGGSTDRSITNITNGNPARVTTSVSHGFNDGNSIEISGVSGMTELNGNTYTIDVISSTTFDLIGVDSTSFGSYTSGGTASRLDGATTIGSGFGSFNRTYTYVVTAVDASGVESLASSEISILSKSLSQTGGVRLQWNAVAGADYYRVYKDPSLNTDVFGWIGDSNNTSFDDYNIAPVTVDAPPQDRQPFDGVGNNPSAVTYYQQRQVFANTTNEPQAVYTTQTGIFNSLRTSTPARDDDAVTFSIAASQVNEIRYLVALDSLILMTSGGEWIATEGQDRVLTPSTIGVRIQSYNGCAQVPPVVINSTALYLQEKGARIRDLGYEFSSDKYTGNDLSIMAEHLFEDHTITSMAYAAEPYSILWCVRDDGVLLGLTYKREHQVWGWHQHTTNGQFESVATISEDGRDAVYAIVKRTIGGQTKRFVERLEKRITADVEDCFYVDSGLTYEGAPATTISGLDHLEGEPVAILADGNVVEGQTVTSGQVTLPQAASKVHVGLAYIPAIETLELDAGAVTESLKSREMSVAQVTLELEKSRGGFIGPRLDFQELGDFTEITPRFTTDGYDAIGLKTYKAEQQIQPCWSTTGAVRVEQRAPLPMAILSVIPQVDIGGN